MVILNLETAIRSPDKLLEAVAEAMRNIGGLPAIGELATITSWIESYECKTTRSGLKLSVNGIMPLLNLSLPVGDGKELRPNKPVLKSLVMEIELIPIAVDGQVKIFEMVDGADEPEVFEMVDGADEPEVLETRTIYNDPSLMWAYRQVYRLFDAIGIFPWQEKWLAAERRFLEVMGRNHPKEEWAELIFGCRMAE